MRLFLSRKGFATILAIILTTVLLPGRVIDLAEAEAEERSTEKKYEQRSFAVPGKGNPDEIAKMQQRSPFSPYEPTGLYVEPNETIEINVAESGNEKLYFYIGTYSYGDESPKVALRPGLNTISDPEGGMLYFSNMNPSGAVNVEVVQGGSPVPFFELGKHSKADWDAMMKLYPDSYAVELKSESALFTITYATAKNLLGNIDPTPLLQKHDEAVKIQNDFAGLSGDTGVNQVDKHYIHYVEHDKGGGGVWMYATAYRTAYATEALPFVLELDKFTKEGWGPWHEQGHLRQERTWTWSGMGEVTNNLYSLEVQKRFGNKSLLEEEGKYDLAQEYFKQTNKDYNAITDAFVKVTMLWQLNLAYGDQFYPELNRSYRELRVDELPTTDQEEEQFFMYMASKQAKQNLVPFFEMWGLYPTKETKEAIEQLHYPLLTAPIWNSTDSLIVEPNLLPNQSPMIVFEGISDWDAATLTFDLENKKIVSSTENRGSNIHPYFEDTYFSFTLYDGVSKQVKKTASTIGKTTPANFVDTLQNTPFKFGDIVKIHHEEAASRLDLYLSPGVELTNSPSKDQYYVITKNGLVPTSDVALQKIVFQGLSDWDAVTLSLDPINQTIIASTQSANSTIHNYFSDTYFSVTLYDATTKKEKLSVSANGTDTPAAFVDQLQGTAYQLGDIIKITHREAASRLDVYPAGLELLNSPDTVQYYQLTENGFSPTSDAALQKIVFQGLSDWDAVTLSLDPLNQTFIASTVNRNSTIHSYFTDTYLSVTLYDGASKNEKLSVSANGTDTPAAFIDKLQGASYQLGDVIKVTHREAVSRLDVYPAGLALTNSPNTVQYFQITENGFVPTTAPSL